MRGKIIQYNGADGSGTIVAAGKQYRFALADWRGDKAPALNKTVEMELDGETVTSVTAVSDDVLMREKAAQMSNKLGAMWKQAATSTRAAGARTGHADPGAGSGLTNPAAVTLGEVPVVGAIVKRYGIVMPVAWLLFLIGSLAFATVSISMSMGGEQNNLSRSMFGAASHGGAGGFFVRLLLILGYLSILVPTVWRDRRAWLALLLPLIAVVWSWIYTGHLLGLAHDKYDEAINAYGGAMAAAAGGVSLHIGHGFGFWLALIMALIVAALAVRRFLGIGTVGVGQSAQ